MRGQGASKPVFLVEYGIFEIDNISKLMLTKQCSACVDLQAILVLVSPQSRGTIILKDETKWVDLGVAGGTIRSLSMRGETLTDGQ